MALERADYMDILAVLNRQEVVSRGASESIAMSNLYTKIATHVQELDTTMRADAIELEITSRKEKKKAAREIARTREK